MSTWDWAILFWGLLVLVFLAGFWVWAVEEFLHWFWLKLYQHDHQRHNQDDRGGDP